MTAVVDGPCEAGDVGYREQHILLNYMGMRPDGSTTMRRSDATVVKAVLTW